MGKSAPRRLAASPENVQQEKGQVWMVAHSSKHTGPTPVLQGSVLLQFQPILSFDIFTIDPGSQQLAQYEKQQASSPRGLEFDTPK